MATWVGQDDPNGCVCASLAMVLGTTYALARSLFPFGPSDEGYFASTSAHRIIKDRGWAVSYRTERKPGGGAWPTDPFADIHMATVLVSTAAPCWHSVVMLDDGTVLDPMTPEPRRLTDYVEVQAVVGFTRKGPPCF